MDWRRLLVLVLAAGLVSAGRHFLRLAILAAVGLAGLYMLHLLAQDYNKISNRPSRPAAAATRALFRALTKRHVAANEVSSTAAWLPCTTTRTKSPQDPFHVTTRKSRLSSLTDVVLSRKSGEKGCAAAVRHGAAWSVGSRQLGESLRLLLPTSQAATIGSP